MQCTQCKRRIYFGWFFGYWQAKHGVTGKPGYWHNHCIPAYFKELV